MNRGGKILFYSVLFILGSYFLFVGLIKAEEFLVPLLTSIVLAFLILPIANKLEHWGTNKILASAMSTVLLLVIILGFLALIFFQVKGFSDEWDEMKEELTGRIEQLNDYIVDKTPLTQEQVDRLKPGMIQDFEGNESNSETEVSDSQLDEPLKRIGEQAFVFVAATFGFLANVVLTFIYIFLLVHFRARFKEFILRLFPERNRLKVSSIITKSSQVSRRYLAGRMLLILILAIMYVIGFTISGLENALLYSIIIAALSILPFIGNVIGYFLVLVPVLLSGQGFGLFIGITVTFSIAQFVESYFLEPWVVGDKVDVHPFFVIVTIILGNIIWGVMGMVLAIPLFGMITVVCRHVPELKPFGYLFSAKDLSEPKEDVKD